MFEVKKRPVKNQNIPKLTIGNFFKFKNAKISNPRNKTAPEITGKELKEVAELGYEKKPSHSLPNTQVEVKDGK